MFFFIALIGFGYAKGKAIAAKEITATYIKSEIGDYNHAIFLDASGKEISFWCSSEMIDFLEQHRGKKMDITYDIKNVFIPEAKKKLRIEVITKVKFDKTEFNDPNNWK